ncbi:MAG: Crp/Fnr family transcriptional regulator [Chitinophagaceae bacterium]
MEELFTFLNNVYPLSGPLCEYLQCCLKYREISRKDYLLKAGHICRHIHFIESGLLRCYYDKGTTEVCSWFMKEGDIIVSIESFYRQVPSYESIQALEDCRLFYIEYNDLDFIYKNYAEFNYIGRELTLNYFILWAQQLYGLRMQNSYERYHWLITNFPELVLRVPAKHIASYLGITEVTLSKIKGMH